MQNFGMPRISVPANILSSRFQDCVEQEKREGEKDLRCETLPVSEKRLSNKITKLKCKSSRKIVQYCINRYVSSVNHLYAKSKQRLKIEKKKKKLNPLSLDRAYFQVSSPTNFAGTE